MSGIRGVTFDYWNTLVAENPDAPRARIATQVQVLADAGVERSAAEVEAAGKRMWDWFHESWHANRAVDHISAGSRLVRELGLVDRERIAGDRVGDRGDEVEPPAVAELAVRLSEVFRRGGDPATMRLADGVGSVLDDLRARGIRIGIISDVGFTPGVRLREYLHHHGLLDVFDGWTFSDEVGHFKPSLRMFEHAAATLGIDEPSSLAHVGDLRRTDVEGARRAGWTGVRFRGLNDDDVGRSLQSEPASSPTPDAELVIDHHSELVGALGLD